MEANNRESIDAAIADFVIHMKHKLLLNRHQGHWRGVSVGELRSRLELEVSELDDALMRGERKGIVREAADVANFCMMIADKAQWLEGE